MLHAEFEFAAGGLPTIRRATPLKKLPEHKPPPIVQQRQTKATRVRFAEVRKIGKDWLNDVPSSDVADGSPAAADESPIPPARRRVVRNDNQTPRKSDEDDTMQKSKKRRADDQAELEVTCANCGHCVPVQQLSADDVDEAFNDSYICASCA